MEAAEKRANDLREKSKENGHYIGFKKLAAETSNKLAAWIGERKYKKDGMKKLAQEGKK